MWCQLTTSSKSKLMSAVEWASVEFVLVHFCHMKTTQTRDSLSIYISHTKLMRLSRLILISKSIVDFTFYCEITLFEQDNALHHSSNGTRLVKRLQTHLVLFLQCLIYKTNLLYLTVPPLVVKGLNYPHTSVSVALLRNIALTNLGTFHWSVSIHTTNMHLAGSMHLWSLSLLPLLIKDYLSWTKT